MNPLVSIIIPCYNQAQYLNETIQCVFDQNYENWECIIVNDGSPDNTLEIAQKWCSKDTRFKYFYKDNGGLSSARNYGIENALGEFILPLDADDKIGSTYTLLAMRAFQDEPNLKLVYCKAEKFGEESGIWDLHTFSLFNLARRNMIFCSAFFRKQEWSRVGGYDTNLIYGLEDWEFWIAILKNGGEVKCLDEIGFYYRVKSFSMAKGISESEVTFSRDYISKKHIDFVLSNYDILNSNRKDVIIKIKSEKVIINLFTKKFFGIKFFNINDQIILK